MGRTENEGNSSEEEISGYDYEFLPSLDNKHMCPICLLALRDPVQTQCGHRFCKPCILRCIRIKRSCPVDQSPLTENELFQDKYAHREVLDLKAKCPHKGCDFVTELRDIQTHMESCELRRVSCKNGCGEVFTVKEIEEHEKCLCTRRIVICSVCQSNYPMDCEEAHEAECNQQLPVECKHCKREIVRYKLHTHITTECLNAPMSCVFEKVGCLQQLRRHDIKEHMENSTQIHLQYLFKTIVKMQTHTTKVDKDIEELVERLQNILQRQESEKEISSEDEQNIYNGSEVESEEQPFDEIDIAKLENKKREEMEQAGTAMASTPPIQNSFLENETSEKIVSIDHHVRELMAKMETQISQMKDFATRLASVEEKLDSQQLRCCNGLYFWKIRDYAKLRQAAKVGDQPVLHSPGFYTSPQGYRMCIRVNLDGVDSAHGTHLSLFVHLMKGDFDEFLSWPFKGVMTLTVINQHEIPEERSHVSETLQAQANLSAFQRPMIERNQKGYGYIDFFPLTMLENGGFIRNDTLVIKAQVIVDTRPP